MANTVRRGLALFALCSVVKLAFSEADPETSSTATATPPKSGRMGRKYYDAEIYSGTDYGGHPFGEHIPRALIGKKNVIPYRHAGSGIMKKSGNNLNWNVWKGDEDNNSETDDRSDNDDIPKWQQPPPQAWINNDAWVADPMTIMLLKNAMSELKAESKPAGFLSKITSDPALLLIAASIPISLLLAAVLPTVLNLAMGGNSIPTVSTTATGTKSRSSRVDIMPYLSPVMEAIGTFGVRSLANPDCVQRIFCEVAHNKMGLKDSKYLKKAATVARFLSHGSWLDSFGVKDLVDSLSNGNCESVPCNDHQLRSKATVKSRYSQKAQSNTLRK